MSNSQVQYKSEKISKKKVYFEGTDTLQEGYALCYNRDSGTAATATIARAYLVEKPATANLKYFAGVVSSESAGVTGPQWVTIIESRGAPTVTNVFTDQSCTLGTTKLAVKNGDYALGAAGSATVNVALALQTVDRSGTDGLVQAQIEDVSLLEVDQAAAVTATQSTITDSSGATSTPRTFSLFAGTGFSDAQVAIANKHAAVTADTLAEVKTDIAAIITALKNANLMAS